MYKFRGNLGVKLTAIILFVIFAALAALSVTGIVLSASLNAYLDGGQQLRENFVSGVFNSKLYGVREALPDAFDVRRMTIDQSKIPKKYLPESTNFYFRVTDENMNVLYQSAEQTDYIYSGTIRLPIAFDEPSFIREFFDYDEMMAFVDLYNAENPQAIIDIAVKNTDNGQQTFVLTDKSTVSDVHYFKLEGYIRSDLPVRDDIYAAVKLAELIVAGRFTFIWACAGSLVMLLVLFVFLMCAAGRKSGVEGVYLGWYDRIPFDLVLAFLGILAYVTLCILDCFYHWELTIAAIVAGTVWLVIFMCNLMSFAARAKEGTWWKNTVIFMVLELLWRVMKKAASFLGFLIKSLPFIWKALLLWLGLSLLELLIFFPFGRFIDGRFVILWFLYKLCTLVMYAICIINLQRLKKEGERIAKGDIERTPDMRYMFGAFRQHAENLGSISAGINTAVEKQLRSEKLKTELITNVSHDIKTPLTSIISYADLLKKEHIENQNARDYIEVIDRQSARLKKLTEDLVEASKAQTGNIAVNAEKTDASVFVAQAFGEYEEKMQSAGLLPMLSLPDRELYIHVDGKLLWRVFDNLFGNICKYAQSGTRVYVSLEKINGKAVISFRNISASPIAVSGDELTERFVRGDKSRNSEGSGLGLSIAKSLTELMGGRLLITVDGDLFKCIIEFDELTR